MSDPGPQSGAIVRHDERGTPPSIWLLALRVGALVGGLFGVYRAIVSWLRVGNAVQALTVWATSAVGGGLAVGVLYLAVLRLNTQGRRTESTEQRTTLQVKLQSPRAFAVAVKALRSVDESLHDVDLVAGAASLHLRVKERFFGTLHLRLSVTVTSTDDGAQIAIESRGLVGAIDFGASRKIVDDLASRVEELIASGRVGTDAVGLEAIPEGALALFRGNGFRVVGLRSLKKDAPAVTVNLLAEGDAAATAIVLTLPRRVTEATLRSAAQRVRAGGASKARVGEGFAIVPLVGGESPGKIAARLYQALFAGDGTRNGGAKRSARSADEKDPASTTRMKWPPSR